MIVSPEHTPRQMLIIPYSRREIIFMAGVDATKKGWGLAVLANAMA
jgi:hypothetical protein